MERGDHSQVVKNRQNTHEDTSLYTFNKTQNKSATQNNRMKHITEDKNNKLQVEGSHHRTKGTHTKPGDKKKTKKGEKEYNKPSGHTQFQGTKKKPSGQTKYKKKKDKRERNRRMDSERRKKGAANRRFFPPEGKKKPEWAKVAIASEVPTSRFITGTG